MNFELIATLSPSARELAIRTLANYANNNLIAITRRRLANFQETGNHDLSAAQVPANEANKRMASQINQLDHADVIMDNRDAQAQAEHVEEIGFTAGETLTRRGNRFASLHASCVEQADTVGISPTSFDYPLAFGLFIDTRIRSLRTRKINKQQIREMARAMLTDADTATKALVAANDKQAADLENQAADLKAAYSDYEITPDEAVFDRFTTLEQLTMIYRVADACVYEAGRLMGVYLQYPGYREMLTKRYEMITDAILLVDEADKFYSEHKTSIDMQLQILDRSMPGLNQANERALHVAKEQLKQSA